MRYLCTLNFGDFMPPNARESLAHAAGRWGCQFLEITRPWTDTPEHDIFRHKLAICDFPAWRFGDEVTLIDGDILIRDDAPYPFTSSQTFAGVVGLQDEDAIEYAKKYAQGMGCPFDAKRYVNGGLLRFYPRDELHRDVFNHAHRVIGIGTADAIEPMLEQTAMNASLLALGDGFEVNGDSAMNTVGEVAWTAEMTHEHAMHYVKHLARWKGKGNNRDERRAAIQAVKWRTR